ncbi:MAG: N-acetyltransferase [Aquificota bacterium]|nr:N-acetyltransferase [Aquificota bacterium]
MMVRKAKVKDAPRIYRLVNEQATKGLLLPRSLSSIYEHIRDFWVFEDSGDIVGCVALQVFWEDLAEIRSLAVREDRRGEGIGRSLVLACLKEAKELGISRVFSLTYARDFFLKIGFREIEKSQLPQKIWTDCVNCIKFPSCDEVAVIIELEHVSPDLLEESVQVRGR